ncbi:MAG: Oligopeptide ABC transporter permease protein [candidate division TA06 bacterium 34_109]|uniref:Oligopeptide ABC transporter permease protein n=1 Tax=candidate division TA06 bacterium 34_109 TaxID=1635277 RepID=A0A101HZL2_UNCT6|nr:MAG: Oligopeptide ABC transporter permease protein [candidate division TA06 bacterium 34_109]
MNFKEKKIKERKSSVKNSKEQIKQSNLYSRFQLKFKGNKIALIAFIILLFIIIVSFTAPLITPYNPTKSDIRQRLKPPTLNSPTKDGFPHIMGTDQQGRDVLSRLMYGGRVSISVAFTVVVISSLIGITIGIVSGYYGGWVDLLLMRLVDICSSFPGLLIALTFVMVLGPSQANLTLALLIVGWMVHARMARSQVLTIRESTMVEALQTIGCSKPRIFIIHIFPNILPQIITVFVLEMAHMIMAEANMSFLGYGIQPPASSWGLMIGDGREYITNAWWLVVFPGIIIAITILCLNIVGNWIKDEFNPIK